MVLDTAVIQNGSTLGDKEAWTLNCPFRKGIKGTDYRAASTCLVETL